MTVERGELVYVVFFASGGYGGYAYEYVCYERIVRGTRRES